MWFLAGQLARRTLYCQYSVPAEVGMSLSFLASGRKMSDTLSFSKSYVTEDSDKIRTGLKNFQSKNGLRDNR